MSESRTITILVPEAETAATSDQMPDREGGQTHSIVKAVKRMFVGDKELEVEKISDSLDDCLEKLSEVFSKMKTHSVDGWEVDSLSVSLGLSAEGSIGIATAGIEGGIEVSFQRKK